VAISKKVRYSFSSALTSLVPEFDLNVFRETIMPIHRLVMNFDGLTGCFMNRDVVDIDYLEEIVGLEQLDAHIKSVFEWVESQDEFFPFLKENEAVSVTRDGATKVKAKKELTLYIWTPDSQYMSNGIYMLFATSLEEAKSMFLEKLTQLFKHLEDVPDFDASQLLNEWKVEERELEEGFILEQPPRMRA